MPNQTNTLLHWVFSTDNKIEISILHHGSLPYVPVRYTTDEDVDRSRPTIHLITEELWIIDSIPVSGNVALISVYKTEL